MKIKQIDISGFKSFCDPVRISLDSAVTAVVGPNGCGKSNIVDALRWTLGETSAKALRGEAMADVIFNGSEKRGPKSMAEVTITFDNTDGLSHPLYVDYTDVSVTRRLYRDGTSEYLINKMPCRKKDIIDLFLGTGGGARAYSIVEQGRVGMIVTARPEDRRQMIEEAAGITKYKAARKASERKMEKTRQNLTRVVDITTEMARNLANLKRHASRAERFKKRRAEQIEHELHVASYEYLRIRAEIMTLHARLTEKQQALEDRKTGLTTSEAELESLRLEAGTIKGRLDEETAAGFELDSELNVEETEIRHLLDTIERCQGELESLKEQLASAETQQKQHAEERALIDDQMARLERDRQVSGERLALLTEELDGARQRLEVMGEAHDTKRDEISRSRSLLAASDTAVTSLTRRIDEMDVGLEAAHESKDALEKEAEALVARSASLQAESRAVQLRLEEARSTEERERAAYNQLKAEVESCAAKRDRVKEELQVALSRKQSIEELMAGLQGHDDSVREALKMLKSERAELVTGLVVDNVASEERYEQAVAAAFGDRLETLLVKDRSAGLAVLDMLKQREMGRVAVAVPTDSLRSGAEPPRVVDDRVIGPLVQLVECDAAVDGLVKDMLRGIFVVSTLGDAEALYEAHGGKAAFVTLDGQLLEAGGVMRGGRARTAGANLLGQKREIRKLGELAAELADRHEKIEQSFGELKESLRARDEAGELARLQAQSEEIALAEVKKDTARASEDSEAIERRRDALNREIAHKNEMLVQAKADKEQASNTALLARERIDELEREIQAGAAHIDACRREVDRVSADISDVRVQKASLDQQWEGAVRRTEQIGQMSLELEERVSKVKEREKRSFGAIGRAAGEVMRHREHRLSRLELSEQVRERIAAIRQDLETAEAKVVEVEAAIRQERIAIEGISKEVSELEINKRESVLGLGHLLQQVRERNDCDLLRVIGVYHMMEEPGEAVFARIEELKQIINNMGPINLEAINEFKAENERYEALIKQRADLEQALEDLERAITKMDKDSQRRFKETFDAVNSRFQEIFPKMFKGGHARLSLTDPDDLLQSGVEIIAQPPGKRLGSIELLSGGEKALTAVSLIFALFLHRPSPFCILDEVDAPLDEANIERVVDMVQQMTERSQFILITHSKITMEKSDALYGITMEEPGISKLVSVKLTKKRHRMGNGLEADQAEVQVQA